MVGSPTNLPVCILTSPSGPEHHGQNSPVGPAIVPRLRLPILRSKVHCDLENGCVHHVGHHTEEPCIKRVCEPEFCSRTLSSILLLNPSVLLFCISSAGTLIPHMVLQFNNCMANGGQLEVIFRGPNRNRFNWWG